MRKFTAIYRTSINFSCQTGIVKTMLYRLPKNVNVLNVIRNFIKNPLIKSRLHGRLIKVKVCFLTAKKYKAYYHKNMAYYHPSFVRKYLISGVFCPYIILPFLYFYRNNSRIYFKIQKTKMLRG